MIPYTCYILYNLETWYRKPPLADEEDSFCQRNGWLLATALLLGFRAASIRVVVEAQ